MEITTGASDLQTRPREMVRGSDGSSRRPGSIHFLQWAEKRNRVEANDDTKEMIVTSWFKATKIGTENKGPKGKNERRPHRGTVGPGQKGNSCPFDTLSKHERMMI